MIPRYSLPEMSVIWSEDHKFEIWQEVETLVVEAWVELGVAPAAAARALRAAPPVDSAAVTEREKITNHDVAAFVDILAESVSTGGEWIHYGLTSSDVLDTANGARMVEAADLLVKRIGGLFDVTKALATEHRHTVMLGRTHGIWAEPTTFGLKLATWAFELARDHERMLRARSAIAVGKISGAVGTYAHTPPAVEKSVCNRLGLRVEPASSQITHRDRHAEFLQTIALTGASIERFATEIRHLQRSEVAEARESFGRGQKGSSAMPHKRNPILSERMTGMARLLRGYAQVGLENVALWHERDISHSSAERVILADACLALDYMLAKFTDLIANLVVDTDRMLVNLGGTHGLVFSQAVLLALIETGMTRDDAYRIVQRSAMRSWDEGAELEETLAADPEVPLTDAALAVCFSTDRFLRNASVVFERLEALDLAGQPLEAGGS
ncbi:MAG: adenylosuccinate lyase [Acidimicrobiia bacterium]|nr:adenylosuccinate lyase [Acidimicrobiia bacterium]